MLAHRYFTYRDVLLAPKLYLQKQPNKLSTLQKAEGSKALLVLQEAPPALFGFLMAYLLETQITIWFYFSFAE